ncbi:Two-component response regulator SSK1p [Thecaphora frezii]
MSSQPQESNPESNRNQSSDLTFSSDSIERAGRPLAKQLQLPPTSTSDSDSAHRQAVFQWPASPLRDAPPERDETAELDPRNDVEQSGEAIPENVELQTADADPRHMSESKEPQASLFASPSASIQDGPDLVGASSSSTRDSNPPQPLASSEATAADVGSSHAQRSSTTWTHRPRTPESDLGLGQVSFLPAALAQTVQIPLNLLRSLIPHPLLESSTPESLSASAMQVPVASIGALMEACQALDWITKQSLNIIGDTIDGGIGGRRSSTSGGKGQLEAASIHRDFDLAEVIQKTADLVGGLAASKGVDIVIGLQPEVSNDQKPSRFGTMLECLIWSDLAALKFLLMSCLANVIQSATPHSTVEIDFNVRDQKGTVLKPNGQPEVSLLHCTIGFTLTPPVTADIQDEQRNALKDDLIAALADNVGGTLQTESRSAIQTTGPDKAPPRTNKSLRHKISLSSGAGQPSLCPHQGQERPNISAPSTKDLLEFAKSLAGRKVAFHAQRHSPFAKHLTNLLTSFGCQVSYVGLNTQQAMSPSGNNEAPGPQVRTAVALTQGRPTLVSYTSDFDGIGPSNGGTDAGPSTLSGTPLAADTAVLDPVTGVPVTFVNRLPVATPATGHTAANTNDAEAAPSPPNGPPGVQVVPFNFVIIDDDIVTLQRELLRLRSAVPMLRSSLNPSGNAEQPAMRPTRPPLDHRTKSSPQIERVLAQHPEMASSLGSVASSMVNKPEPVSQVIIFFTSLRSYRLVRDTVQPIIDSASFSGGAPPPEVMVLPKPAGSRRILTALYTAEHKPMVDAPFLPIATSPTSPSYFRGKSWWDNETGSNGAPMMLVRQHSDLTSPSTPWSPSASFQSSELQPAPFSEDPSPEAPPLAPGFEAQSMSQGGQNTSQDTALPSRGSESAPGVQKGTSSSQSTASATGTASRSTKAEQNPSRPASTSASASHASTQASRFHKSNTPHSPLPPDALEYFSETAAKMGGSGASGMVIQSPDGRPAGIFFQPKSSSSVSSAVASTSTSFRRANSTTPNASGGGLIEQGGSGDPEPSSTSRDPIQAESMPRSVSAGITSLSRLTGDGNDPQTGAGGSGRVSGRPRAATSRSTKPSGLEGSHSASRYPKGSIFAPQVGIRSVLNSSRPPMATPLSSNTGPTASNNMQTDPQWTPTQAKSATTAPGEAAQSGQSVSPARSSGQADQMTSKGETSAKADLAKRNSSPKTTAVTPSAADTPPRRKVAKPASSNGSSPATKDAQAMPPAKRATRLDAKQLQATVPSSPVNAAGGGGGSRAVASKLMARQTFAAVPSPSDSRKPSAQPQSGFMIGMGFAPTARRGTGPKKAPVREAVLPPIKVLIVEDNPINQRILSTFMSRQKIKYDVANNGREAVEKWQTGGFHLILMDIQLPVMDGIEATKEIRKLEQSANIGILPNTPPTATSASGVASRRSVIGSSGGGPHSNPSPFRAQVIIVALTASVLSSDRVEALAAGCNDFLNKPVSLPWLNQKILEWGSMMYLMYSGLSSDEASALNPNNAEAATKAQVHIGFGYGPAEKAKALASNLHIGAAVGRRKKEIAKAKGKEPESQQVKEKSPE